MRFPENWNYCALLLRAFKERFGETKFKPLLQFAKCVDSRIYFNGTSG